MSYLNNSIDKNKKTVNYIEQNIKHNDKDNLRFEQAKAYYEYGKFLKINNQESQARDQWQKAYTIFKAIDNQLYVQKCENLLRYNINPRTEQSLSQVIENIKVSFLVEVSNLLKSISDINTLIERIMDISLEITGAEQGILLLYPNFEEKKNELNIVVRRNINQSNLDTEEFRISKTIIQNVEVCQKSVIILDAVSDTNIKDITSVVRHNQRSILCVPLLFREKMMGLIYLDSRVASGIFTEEKKSLMEALSVHIAFALENARLHIQSQEAQKKIEALQAKQNKSEDIFHVFCSHYNLTKREQEVTALLIKGFSHKNIANKLFISSQTVKSHVKNIYAKTEVNNIISLLNLILNTKPSDHNNTGYKNKNLKKMIYS